MHDHGPPDTPGEPLIGERRREINHKSPPKSEAAGHVGGENPLVTGLRGFENGRKSSRRREQPKSKTEPKI